jgi:uncharacterized protein YjbI with pentapeptide repeats
MPKPTPEEIEYLRKDTERWAAFQKWWGEDWSWDGLPSKMKLQTEDGSAASLQDYWRDLEGSLVEFGGRRWTIAHLPPCDSSGNVCPDWQDLKSDKFWSAIWARLPEVSLPLSDAIFVDGIKPQPAMFYGVAFPMWRASKDNKIISAHFDKAIFFGWCDFKGLRIAHTFFDEARFVGDALYFSNAQFLSGAHFAGAHLLSSSFVTFSEADFAGGANFDRATIKHADFTRARFHDGCNFSETNFAGSGPHFVGAEFGGGYAHFDRSICDGVADFSFAKFDSVASFEDAEFKYDAYFRSDKGGRFASAADFNGAVFNRTADFSGRAFSQTTDFRTAKFKGLPMFYDCELVGETLFDAEGFKERPWRTPINETTYEHEIERDHRERVRRRQIRFNDPMFRHRRVDLKQLSDNVPKHLAANRLAKDYEHAFRALRRLTASVGNVDDEMNFHALELDARSARTDVPPFERGIILAYRAFSDYGRSMWRPVWTFLVIATLVVLAATPLTWHAINQYTLTLKAIAPPTRVEVGMFLARNFIPPPPVWSENLGRAWSVGLDDIAQILLLMLGTLQTLTFVGFVTLFVIALRRRFRIPG